MSFEEVVYETDGHVATVTLSRPGKLNAWTLRMSQEVLAGGDATGRRR